MTLALCFAAAALLAGCGAPASPGEPDGRLVLAVLDPERVMVADPRTGASREREVPSGTLCHGPVLAVGNRVVYAGVRRGRAVALSRPLDLRGTARTLGRAALVRGNPGLRLLRNPQKGVRHLLEGSGDVRIPGGWPLAVGTTQVAWCRGQAVCRRAGVWSAGGSQALVPPRGVRLRLGGGAFSPDGRRLALPVTAHGRSRVAVVEPRTGRWWLGGRLAGYRAIAWSPSGRWVYATVGARITAWAPGGAPPRVLPIRTGGTVMSIATTR